MDLSTFLSKAHAAEQRLRLLFDPTPVVLLERLSGYIGKGVRILCKQEHRSPFTKTFKDRGSEIYVGSLGEEELREGIVAATAGNHGAAAAAAAIRRGSSAVVCMPYDAPQAKIRLVKNIGAEVRLFADLQEAYREGPLIASRERRVFVPGFNHPLIITGQATCGLEVLQQVPQARIIFVPCGGGGLLAGITAAVRLTDPSRLVFGVEHDRAASMVAALDADYPVLLEDIDTWAEGAAVAQVGDIPFGIVQQLVSGMVVVDRAAINDAAFWYYEETGGVELEPAGAFGIAAAIAYAQHPSVHDQDIVAIVTGAVVDEGKWAEMEADAQSRRSSTSWVPRLASILQWDGPGKRHMVG